MRPIWQEFERAGIVEQQSSADADSVDGTLVHDRNDNDSDDDDKPGAVRQAVDAMTKATTAPTPVPRVSGGLPFGSMFAPSHHYHHQELLHDFFLRHQSHQ